MAPRIVDVLVPVALDHAYSYRAPAELNLQVGDIVSVPLGPREAIGVVWADNVAVRPGLHNRLKDVERPSSTTRRFGRNCAASSTGCPTTRSRPEAWCCA